LTAYLYTQFATGALTGYDYSNTGVIPMPINQCAQHRRLDRQIE
jgi:hypothetical protein